MTGSLRVIPVMDHVWEMEDRTSGIDMAAARVIGYRGPMALLPRRVLPGLFACALALVGCGLFDSPQPSTPDTSPVVSGEPAETPAATASASPSSAPEGAIGPRSMVRAVAGGISLRAEAGVAAERLGSLALDSRSVVLSGPQSVDGYEWYELSGPGLPPASGCTTPLPTEPLTCPIWHGWAAAGDPATGEAWLVSDPTDCPEPAADMTAFAVLGDYEAIHCYGDSEVTFAAWLVNDPAQVGPCPATDVPSRWLWCHDGWTAHPGPNEVSIIVPLFFDPNSGISITADQRMAQITGHHDDPAAAGCAEAVVAESGIPPATAVRDCRGRFVVTAIADAPAP